ncbi:unnamed protein product [Bursaphelenchus xylophilus]|uniref:(pine wood nematode) hypothetical protein n=1 Tax=Bursaphelenchus xylophilus TaxID=6326 RepID=A0A1I7RIS7_BURXY|nr:unnamed protein product [Bursaphelenchus xylophilus]CAG9119064.1 unnamed protein product [Bursaphelenchus xylophilus]
MTARTFLWAVLLHGVAVQALHHHDALRAKLDLMTKNMNTTADPCNDFFTYAVGNFNASQLYWDTLAARRRLLESSIGDEIPSVKQIKPLLAACKKNPAMMDDPNSTDTFRWIVDSFKSRGFTFPMKNEVLANDDGLFTNLVLEMYVYLLETGAPFFDEWGYAASGGKLTLNITPKVNQEEAWKKYCNVIKGCADLAYDRNYMPQGYVQADHLKGRFFDRMMGLNETFPGIAFYVPQVFGKDPSQSANRANFLNHLMEYLTDQIHRPKKFYQCEDYIFEALPLHTSKIAYELEMTNKTAFAELKAKFTEKAEAVKKTAERMLRNANFTQEQTRQNYLDRLAKNEFPFLDHPILFGKELAAVDHMYLHAPYMRRFMNGITHVFMFNAQKELKNFVVPEYKSDAIHKRENQHNYIHWKFVEFPYFDVEFPALLDSSGTGFWMSQSLAHTFDDLLEAHEDPEKEHRARWDCIAMLYSGQCDPQRPDVCLNTTKTAGEALADQVGVRLAYFSHFAPGNNISEPRISEQFSNEQLFFINIANTLAWSYSWKDYNPTTSVHMPNRARVWGALANFKGFAEAFNCPVGSRYHVPVDQACNIFDFDIVTTTTKTTTAATTTVTIATTTTTEVTTTAATTAAPTTPAATTAMATEITTTAATTTAPTTTATTTGTTARATTTMTAAKTTTSTEAQHEPVVTDGTPHASTNTPPAPGPTKSTPNPHTATKQSTPGTTPSMPRTTPPMPRTTPSKPTTTPSQPTRSTPLKPKTTPSPPSPVPDYNSEEYGEVAPKKSILLSPPYVFYPILAFAHMMFQ